MKNIIRIFNKKYKVLAIIAILILSFFIYTYKLSKIPGGFYVDEAVVAYNARSILETGKDIFAQPHPILFRLLGSYTPPLFIYTSSVFIKFLGMDPYVFRLISAICALVSIIFFYLFIKKLSLFKSDVTYFIITFYYAISPWMIFNARLGYETTLAYLLFNIGIYFFLLVLNNPKSFIWGMIFFSLSTYTAHTQRYLVPIFLTFYLIVFAQGVFKRKNIRYLIVATIITLIIQIPHFIVLRTPAFWVKNDRLLSQSGGKIIHSVINQTFSYLSTNNLFVKLSDIDAQHTIPEISVMYDWMVIPYLIGLYWLFRRIKEKNIKYLLLIFFTSLIPAIFSGEFLSIQRALPFLLPLAIVIGLGIDNLIMRMGRFCIFALFILTTYSLLMLYRSYFVLFPIERAEGWNYGYDKVTEFITENPQIQFIVDNSRNPRNYILLLYYLSYPPGKYQLEVNERYKVDYYRSLPPEDSYKFSNIEVRVIDWRKDVGEGKIIIGDSLSVGESQIKEHCLTKVLDVKDFFNDSIILGYTKASCSK